MRVSPECFPCFMRQTLIALSHAGADEGLQISALKGTAQLLQSVDTSLTPAHFTTHLHRWIRQTLGRDPFAEIKGRYNAISMGLYAELKAIIQRSPEPLETAVRLAIAGNIIDFGIFTSIDIKGTIERALQVPLAVDRYRDFVVAIDKSESIIYLTDNTGEIVFDRVLIEELIDMGKEVTAVVKGTNVLNDATMQDARDVGLTDICKVIDNGSDCVGTILDWTPKAFREEFQRHPTVISKGQGNFETLHNYPGDRPEIFFLFQSKCDALSKMLGLQKGSMLLASNRRDFKSL